MRFIKKFEAFKHRIPNHATDSEFRLKMETNKKEPFSDSEIEFFKKLKADNNLVIYDLDIRDDFGITCGLNYTKIGNKVTTVKGGSTVFIVLYPNDETEDLIEVNITKLTDSYYLVYEVGIDKFICDDWDEVLGYLGTQTILRF